MNFHFSDLLIDVKNQQSKDRPLAIDVGEITKVFKKVFSEFEEPVKL